MQLDHERLDVYELALEFLVLANGIIEGLPRGRSDLADQFTRASLSIVLNLAEGAGKHSKLDKRRYELTARGSATESAALLDVCVRLKLLDEAGHKTAKGMLVRVVSMLIKLAQSCEDGSLMESPILRSFGHGHGHGHGHGPDFRDTP
jgi:four helix bundle protein